MARLDAHLGRLRSLHAALMECDGRLCLVDYLRQQPAVCWARESGPRELHLEAMRNPLLDDAQPLSLDLRGEGAFLTGQNGVGKSTFLRAVGLNLLTARAFGFCHAARAAVPMTAVWASMVHEDSIETGDSLYMAEMRRAQCLLQVAERAECAVFLVDEIFRGTNHIESVAGAAAVLNRLASAGMLIVSSHNVVLAPLLRARLAPWRIVRAGERGLAIEPGILREPNGLEMMARYGIADAVRAEALRVHDWFAGHVATPVAFPPLA
jgi:DNA mismatch repair ATPase MutS